MGGVYGDFLEVFAELHETFSVWTKEDKSDIRTVRAVLMPTKGDGIKRRKYTSGNTALDIQDIDELYITARYKDLVHPGDYIQKKGDPYIMRLTNDVPYVKAAGYMVFTIERVTGTTSDHNMDLKVKEATFA